MSQTDFAAILVGLGGTAFAAGAVILWPGTAMGLVALGVLLIALSIFLFLAGRGIAFPRLMPMWEFTWMHLDWMPFRTTISVNSAVRRVYDRLQGEFAGQAARSLGSTAENFIYTSLRGYAIWGTRPGLRKLVKLPSNMLAYGILDMETNVIREPGENGEIFENVQMLRRDMKDAMRHLHDWDMLAH